MRMNGWGGDQGLRGHSVHDGGAPYPGGLGSFLSTAFVTILRRAEGSLGPALENKVLSETWHLTQRDLCFSHFRWFPSKPIFPSFSIPTSDREIIQPPQ